MAVKLRSIFVRIAICDDDGIFVTELNKILTEAVTPQIVTEQFTDSDALVSRHIADSFDVVFLDIELGKNLNGVDVCRKLCSINDSTKVIYVTAYTEKFIEEIYLKNSNACGIIPKPVNAERIIRMLDKAAAEINEDEPQYIHLTDSGSKYVLPVRSITYLESHLHHVTVFTDDKVYRCYKKLQDFEYLSDFEFLHCHKSYIVNMSRISHTEKESFVLDNGVSVPISRSHRQSAKERFMNFLSGKINTSDID